MTFRRYLTYFRPHAGGLVVAAILLAASAALPGAAILLLNGALEEVLAPTGSSRLGAYCAGLAAVAGLEAALMLGRTRLSKRIALQVTSELRQRLHAHLLTLSPSQQEGTGQRLAVLTHDVDELQYGVSALLTAIRNPLTVIVLAVTAARMAPGLSALAALLAPALAVIAGLAGRALRDRARRRSIARARLVDLLHEQLAGLRTVQAFAAEAREHARFVALEDRDRGVRLDLEVERTIPAAAVRVVAATALAGLLWLGGRQVAEGALEPGALVAFAAALALIQRPLSGLGEVWSLLQRSLAALEEVERLLATPGPARPAPPARLPPGPLEVRWEGVTVDYGDGPVLRTVDLVAPSGEILAIVGPTGAGKSTLLGLVGARRPTSGVVAVGGVDLRALDPAELGRSVAVVSQETFLFARTIRENVTFGRPDATEVQVRRALEDACLLERVDAIGLDTTLDEGAARLSGGERQRLALARALLCEAPVLLLDEPTSQLDAQTWRAVVARVAGLRGRATVILVTHDPEVAAVADRVAVLVAGRCVEIRTGIGTIPAFRHGSSAGAERVVPAGGAGVESAVPAGAALTEDDQESGP